MQRLIQGVSHFQQTGFRKREELFSRLKAGQQPEACLITCADSRIVPSLLTSADPGQLFIVRNVGNIIPCYGTDNNAELAAVEFSVVELGIRDVIVCGHTGCGAMKALLASQAPGAAPRTPCVQAWLRHADATNEIIREHYGHLTGEALVNAAAEQNVLVQLEHLRSLPAIAARLPLGKVRLHGWMYNIGTGEVSSHDAASGRFASLSASPENAVTGGVRGKTDGS
jgi:carbonic anhydrase